MSYSERYKGTKWGQPPDPDVWGEQPPPEEPDPTVEAAADSPAPPPPPPVPFDRLASDETSAPPGPPRAPRRMPVVPRALAVVALLLIFAGMAAGGFFLTGGKLPSPTHSHPASAPAPTPSPSVVVQRYLKLVSNPKATAHVRLALVVDTPTTDRDLRGEMDMSGVDWKGIFRLKSAGKTRTVEIVMKAGRIYTRVPRGKWTRVPSTADPTGGNPINTLGEQNALVDMGAVIRNGKPLHRLHLASLANVDALLKSYGAPGTVESFSGDVYVTAAGVPVESVLKMRVRSDKGVTNITLSYVISKFNKPVRIVAPM